MSKLQVEVVGNGAGVEIDREGRERGKVESEPITHLVCVPTPKHLYTFQVLCQQQLNNPNLVASGICPTVKVTAIVALSSNGLDWGTNSPPLSALGASA